MFGSSTKKRVEELERKITNLESRIKNLEASNDAMKKALETAVKK